MVDYTRDARTLILAIEALRATLYGEPHPSGLLFIDDYDTVSEVRVYFDHLEPLDTRFTTVAVNCFV